MHFVLYNSRLRLQYPKFTVWFYLSEEGRFFSFNQEKIHLFHIFNAIFTNLFRFSNCKYSHLFCFLVTFLLTYSFLACLIWRSLVQAQAGPRCFLSAYG